MPTESLTLSIYNEELGAASTWEANWALWQINSANTMGGSLSTISGDFVGVPSGFNQLRTHSYGAYYPELTDEEWPNQIADGNASIVINGPPVYQGYVTGKGHHWAFGVQITTPDFFYAFLAEGDFSSGSKPAYLPFPYFDVIVAWTPTFVDDSDIRDSTLVIIHLGYPWYFQGGVSLHPADGGEVDAQASIDADDSVVTASGSPSTSPNGAIAFYGWQILNDQYKFIQDTSIAAISPQEFTDGGGNIVGVGAELWGPYVGTELNLEYELPGEGTYFMRLVAIDEHGYVRGSGIIFDGTFYPNVFVKLVSESGQFGSLIDVTGTLFTAVNEGTAVRVSQFKRKSSTRELLATVENARNASIFQDATGRIVLGYTDRSDSHFKTLQSVDSARSFS